MLSLNASSSVPQFLATHSRKLLLAGGLALGGGFLSASLLLKVAGAVSVVFGAIGEYFRRANNGGRADAASPGWFAPRPLDSAVVSQLVDQGMNIVMTTITSAKVSYPNKTLVAARLVATDGAAPWADVIPLIHSQRPTQFAWHTSWHQSMRDYIAAHRISECNIAVAIMTKPPADDQIPVPVFDVRFASVNSGQEGDGVKGNIAYSLEVGGVAQILKNAPAFARVAQSQLQAILIGQEGPGAQSLNTGDRKDD